MRGFDAGTNLKTTSGWYENGNGTDLFGFSGLPGGYRASSMVYFFNVGSYGFWWTSTEGDGNDAWDRGLITTTRVYAGTTTSTTWRIRF